MPPIPSAKLGTNSLEHENEALLSLFKNHSTTFKQTRITKKNNTPPPLRCPSPHPPQPNPPLPSFFRTTTSLLNSFKPIF